MTLKLTSLTAALSLLIATPVLPDEASRLAGLPKDEFVDAYENYYVSLLDITQQLITRLDPDLADAVDTTTPVSAEERSAFVCIYEFYTDAGLTDDLIDQMTAMEPLRDRMQTNPALNYADLLFDETLQAEIAPQNAEAGQAAMRACGGGVTLAGNRLDLSPEFWAIIQQEAEARNLADTN